MGATVTSGRIATEYEKLWNQRTTPWAVGDTFAIWGDDGRPAPGVIFLTRGRFAVGSLLRDPLYRIPARVQDLTPALAYRHSPTSSNALALALQPAPVSRQEDPWPVAAHSARRVLGDRSDPAVLARYFRVLLTA